MKKANPMLLGIDFGSTNIGIALGHDGIVAPTKVIPGKDVRGAINEIVKIALENKVDRLVVGVPLTAEGKETQQARLTYRFAKLLRTFSKKPVDFHNEYGSSMAAMEESMETGVAFGKKKPKDHLAAALILRGYFREKQNV